LRKLKFGNRNQRWQHKLDDVDGARSSERVVQAFISSCQFAKTESNSAL